MECQRNIIRILRLLIFYSLFTIINPGQGEAASNYSGSLETAAYTYSTMKKDLSGTETNYRLYENVLFDFKFNDRVSFSTNNRVIYRGLETRKDANEDPQRLDLNNYYTYFDFKISDSFSSQVGRIMDVNNLVFSYYDGINVIYKKKFGEYRLGLNIYGGLLVDDDYLEDDNRVYGYNSFDVRNFYIEQRKGDYISGAKLNLASNKIGVFTLDYQTTMNDKAMAENYVSIDFDTMFSKLFKAYGYGTYDIVDKKLSNGLGGMRLSPGNLISLSAEYQYYRPVFIKDSFFWVYFTPYGHHAVTGSLLLFFTPIITFDVKYSRLIFEGANETGDEFSASLEDRSILGFGILITGSGLKSPLGDKYTGLCTIKRRFFNILDISVGGGAVYFDETPESTILSKAYVGRAGIGLRMGNLIISGDAEYFNNPKYKYDTRAIVSAKFIF